MNKKWNLKLEEIQISSITYEINVPFIWYPFTINSCSRSLHVNIEMAHIKERNTLL
jgi:hypothetical protein